jgi:hypothetical protein
VTDPDGSWYQQAKISAGDTGYRNHFGNSVAISGDGNTAIVGAFRDDPVDSGGTTYSNAGAAYIFTRSGVTWAQQAKISAGDKSNPDFFGWSVAISGDGNTVIVGEYRDDPVDSEGTIIVGAGSAYIFTRSDVTWAQKAKISAGDKDRFDGFGDSVAISEDGNTVIVGAPDSNDEVGSAYIFTRSGESWTQQAKIQAWDKDSGDYFGISVAISGDGNTAIVGAVLEDPEGVNEGGSAYIFTRSGGSWYQQAKINAGDTGVYDLFGYGVGISRDGNTAIVGASGNDPEGVTDAGSAYIFTRTGTTWAQQAKINAGDTGDNVLFGYGVAISGDGNTAIVGADGDDPGGVSMAGSAYIFTRSGVTWAQKAKISARDKEVDDLFGGSVAISRDGNTAIVGAEFEDSGGLFNAGSAYIFIPISRDYRMVVTD